MGRAIPERKPIRGGQTEGCVGTAGKLKILVHSPDTACQYFTSFGLQGSKQGLFYIIKTLLVFPHRLGGTIMVKQKQANINWQK